MIITCRLVATVLFAVLLLATRAAYSADFDYCSISKQSKLIVVDRTTRYDDVDRAELINYVGSVVDRLVIGDRLVVAEIGEHRTSASVHFSRCLPGCPTNSGVLSQCSAMRARADARRYRSDLIATLTPLTRNQSGTSHSDITGSIYKFTSRPEDNRPYSEIHIISDMLENSVALPWREFSTIDNSELLQRVERYRLKPVAPKARVVVSGFGRMHDAARTPLDPDVEVKVRDFWTRYFELGGARAVTFD